MIELFEKDLQENNWKSSKGNQLKWQTGGSWYKADYLGYEGLSEYIVSHLLGKSSLSPQEYVLYEPEVIRYKNSTMKGAKSLDFLDGKRQIITLERLFDTRYHCSFYKSVFSIADHRERLRFLIDKTIQMTGLKEFAVYMTKLLTVDALFLNEDRHLHNIAVLMDEQGRFDYCPLFDFGASLLSDTRLDYPPRGDVYEYIASAKAKTICDSFQEQVEIAEEMTGQVIRFDFSLRDVEELTDKAGVYGDAEKTRVKTIIAEQRRRYAYLF